MGLREKTQQKFVGFFEKMARMHEGNEFELAYSDIQRSTESANSTLKRALEAMVAEGSLDIQPGRNSRYGRFRYLAYQPPAKETEFKAESVEEGQQKQQNEFAKPQNPAEDIQTYNDLKLDIKELAQITSHLLRRVRNQEMTIALLQDRIAELEDKLYKR